MILCFALQQYLAICAYAILEWFNDDHWLIFSIAKLNHLFNDI